MLQSYPAAAHAPGTPSPEAPHWIDLLDPSEEEKERVKGAYGISIPSREQLQEIESSSRLRLEGQVLYLSMPLAVEDDRDYPAPLPVGFILAPQLLITVRFSDIHVFNDVRARIAETGAPAGSAGIFTSLVEGMVDFTADMLEKLSSRLAGCSREVFERQGHSRRRAARFYHRLRGLLAMVGEVGGHLSRIRESLLGLQRISGFVSEGSCEWMTPQIRTRLATVHTDLASLADFEEHLSGKTQFLLDAILGFINTEQNDTFKVLTIVSVVGIPPTLIASMYGMNFHNMPELSWPWGYQYGLALIALSTIVPILWFKWRGWW
jgi:magnesium transporter